MDPESRRAAANEIELLGVQHAPQGLQERGETEERFDCSGGAERGPGSNHTLRKCASRQVPVPAVVLAAVTVIMLITIITIAALAELLRVEKSKPPVAAPGPPAGPCCPEDWIGYRGKCYYFSETDGNWTYSQSQRSALSASLAAIDSEQEKRTPGLVLSTWEHRSGSAEARLHPLPHLTHLASEVKGSN